MEQEQVQVDKSHISQTSESKTNSLQNSTSNALNSNTQIDKTENNKAEDALTKPSKKSVASRGIPSKESMFLPAHDSALIRSFEDLNENPTRNIWDITEVTMFIFPKKYQEQYHHIAISFLALLMQKTKLEGSELSQFIKNENISKATFYNRVIPRLKRVGMIKVQRQTIVAKESKRKFRPMTIHLSKTFGNYMGKISDSWLAIVDEARSKHDQQKRLENFKE